MDTTTAEIKPAAAPGRVRVRAIAVGPKTVDPAYQVAPVEVVDPQTVGNHFLETMEKIRQKNREVAAARSGSSLARANAIKTAGHLPEIR